MTGVAAVAGVIGMHYMFVLFTLFYKAAPFGLNPWAVVTSDFWPIALLYFAGIVVYVGFVIYLSWKNWHSAAALACGLCGLPLLDLAIGIGGYGFRYMLFITPAILALVVTFFKKRNIPLTIVIGVVLCAASLLYRPSSRDDAIGMNTKAIEESRNLDAFMEDCHFKTYAFSGEDSIFAFSRFSPIGPMFSPYAHTYLTFNHPLYQQTYQNIIADGQVLITQKKATNAPDPIPAEVRGLFSDQAPPCALGKTLSGYVLHYRK